MPDRDAGLEEIYQELLLDHFRRPRNAGKLDAPDISVQRLNPLCGDSITLQLAFDGDTITGARFEGVGCAISRASASMMVQRLEGGSRADAIELRARVRAMLMGNKEAAEDSSLGDLRALAGVARLPMRVKCALLAWSALEEGLAGRGDVQGKAD
jgi:nitrogen fixation NifU-like protein